MISGYTPAGHLVWIVILEDLLLAIIVCMPKGIIIDRICKS